MSSKPVYEVPFVANSILIVENLITDKPYVQTHIAEQHVETIVKLCEAISKKCVWLQRFNTPRTNSCRDFVFDIFHPTFSISIKKIDNAFLKALYFIRNTVQDFITIPFRIIAIFIPKEIYNPNKEMENLQKYLKKEVGINLDDVRAEHISIHISSATGFREAGKPLEEMREIRFLL